MAETRDVKFCTQVGYIKSYNKKITPIGPWLWSRDLFKFLVPLMISPERIKLETQNFVKMQKGYDLALGLQTVS